MLNLDLAECSLAPFVIHSSSLFYQSWVIIEDEVPLPTLKVPECLDFSYFKFLFTKWPILSECFFVQWTLPNAVNGN